jgi:hypothetical protein
MNERYYDPAVAKAVTETGQRLVRDLARRAGFCVTSTDIFTSKLEHLPITQDMEKFAVLIIDECITVVQDGGGMCGAISSNNLKEHFGVEQ